MTTKQKTPRKPAKKKKETDQLTALLNEAAVPAPTPEVLVPGKDQDWVLDKVEQLRTLASLPKKELLGRAEKAVVKQARKFLKANAEYGISVSGFVRTSALFLLSFPLKRQER